MALGKVKDLKEAREIIKNSFPIKVYEPKDGENWNQAYAKFQKIAKL